MLFFFQHKTAYEMRISDWSSDVCSSDLSARTGVVGHVQRGLHLDHDFSCSNLTGNTAFHLETPHLPPVLVPSGSPPASKTIFKGNAEIGRASCRERLYQYV